MSETKPTSSKLHRNRYFFLARREILDQVIERSSFLFMNRVDKLAQAISLAIAVQNNRWAWGSPGGLPDDRLAYSAERISQHLRHITLLNLRFEQFFGLNGIVPITVEYERLVNTPQQELDQIASRIGLNGLRMDSSRLKFRRQANEINQAWRSRFLLETSAPPKSSFGAAACRGMTGSHCPVRSRRRSFAMSGRRRIRISGWKRCSNCSTKRSTWSPTAMSPMVSAPVGWRPVAIIIFDTGSRSAALRSRSIQLGYSAQYPLAAMEVARGDYGDFIHHYVAAGRARGCRPMPA